MISPKMLPLVMILALFGCAPMWAQSPGAADTPAYPNSEEGLRNFINDMVAAEKVGNSAQMSAYLASLPIPDHASWFAITFGTDGSRLDAKYQVALAQLPDSISRRLKYVAGAQGAEVRVKILQKPADSNLQSWQVIAEARRQPVPFYSAEAASPDQKYPAYLGEFVYVDGAFRSVDFDIFRGLSAAPALRMRQAGNVTAASILYQPAPVYPEKARAEHIEGTVVLHAIISKDGSIKSLEIVSGSPDLADAAEDAVKLWRYKPTLLNGQPVEIDTNITVTFELNR